MANGNSYEKLLQEITSILEILESSKNQPLDDARLPSDIFQKLAALEKKVNEFEKKGEDVLSISYEIPDELKELIPLMQTNNDLPPEAKRIVNITNVLIAKIDTLQSQLVEKNKSEIQKAPKQAPLTKKEMEKGSGQKRKGKFRHLGGDPNWKPM